MNLGSAVGFYNPLKYNDGSAHSAIQKNLADLAKDLSPNIQMINMNIGMSAKTNSNHFEHPQPDEINMIEPLPNNEPMINTNNMLASFAEPSQP